MSEHVDVLIIGAGISGIGAAYHLQERRPDASFVMLDALDHYGGTWWTHKYPGVRSDSDLFTFGYGFKPWKGAPLASAAEIMKYLGEVVEDADLEKHMRFRTRINAASWSTDTRQWTVTAENLDSGETTTYTCNFLWMCQGYYKHHTPYVPEWDGFSDFEGEVIHPQQWPDDLDLSGKKVVVIGSGATAATLIPNIAYDCEHVTMLQRSPTFFVARPNNNELADTLRDLDIPDEWTHEIVRRKILKEQEGVARMAEMAPDMVRGFLVEEMRKLLPEGFDVDKHFNPAYRPWQQRLAVLPDGDLFKAIRLGRASVATDKIARFMADGIELESGEKLDADVVITATGFDLSVLGDIDFTIDEEKLDASETVTYRGAMFTGVPNLATVFGYFRASWTLRADLISDLVCRLLDHMDGKGASMVVPQLRDEDRDMTLGPWVDPENFNPGYLMRSMHLMPKQGDRDPWRLLHEYTSERALMADADFEDGTLLFK